MNFFFSKNGKIINKLLNNIDDWKVHVMEHNSRHLFYELKHISGISINYKKYRRAIVGSGFVLIEYIYPQDVEFNDDQFNWFESKIFNSKVEKLIKSWSK